MSTPPLILASASPRRRQLLREAGVRFTIQAADLDEQSLPGEAPEPLARRLAREKALAVAAALADPSQEVVVLGADTLVVLGDRVFGKPGSPEEAVSHLMTLCGAVHRVITGVALVAPSGEVRDFAVASEVHLRAAPEDEIRRYVETGEPMDKAGAYAVQGEGRRFVAKVVGSETNVIGLPMDETLAALAAHGVSR
jgi:septum formation protein